MKNSFLIVTATLLVSVFFSCTKERVTAGSVNEVYEFQSVDSTWKLLTLREKIGQTMLMLPDRKKELDLGDGSLDVYFKRYPVTGYFMGWKLFTGVPEEERVDFVRSSVEEYQKASELPLLFQQDYESGVGLQGMTPFPKEMALGHHFDDVIETILMGMLYSGKVETMMPKLHSQNFEGMELIRPLYMVKEDAIKAWRDYNGLHFIQCACRFTENCVSCGGGRGSKRDEMKELVAQFRKTSDVIETNIFNSVRNINLRTVIGYHKDKEAYNFLDDYDLRGSKKSDSQEE